MDLREGRGDQGVLRRLGRVFLDELGLISPSLRLPLREQFRAYYRAHPEAMEPHPPAAPLSPISIAEAQ